MKDKEKIIDRVRKIIALADSSDYEGEVAKAMAMARRLMAEYSISVTDLDEKEQFGKVIIPSCSLRWKRLLLGVLGQFFGVSQCYCGRTKSIEVYGAIDHLEVFQACAEYALKEVLAASKGKGRSTINSYRISMVVGIKSVLTEHERSSQAETAIIAVNGAKAKEYMLKQITVSHKKQPKIQYYRQQDAYQQGVRVGEQLKGAKGRKKVPSITSR
jgi:hypothetical protein